MFLLTFLQPDQGYRTTIVTDIAVPNWLHSVRSITRPILKVAVPASLSALSFPDNEVFMIMKFFFFFFNLGRFIDPSLAFEQSLCQPSNAYSLSRRGRIFRRKLEALQTTLKWMRKDVKCKHSDLSDLTKRRDLCASVGSSLSYHAYPSGIFSHGRLGSSSVGSALTYHE